MAVELKRRQVPAVATSTRKKTATPGEPGRVHSLVTPVIREDSKSSICRTSQRALSDDARQQWLSSIRHSLHCAVQLVIMGSWIISTVTGNHTNHRGLPLPYDQHLNSSSGIMRARPFGLLANEACVEVNP